MTFNDERNEVCPKDALIARLGTNKVTGPTAVPMTNSAKKPPSKPISMKGWKEALFHRKHLRENTL